MAFHVVVLLATYAAYIKALKVDVVFYASIFSSIFAAAISALVLTRFARFTSFEKLQMAFCFLLIGYIFSISVPTVIDRSLSFYILEKLQQRGGGIQLEQFDFVFKEEYLPEHRLMEIRITEQIESGTIELDGECVRLTDRGARLASFSRFFRAHLLPKARLVGDDYTDDLTDPFRQDRDIPDYRC